MLDRDLAELYEVETRILNQAVRRNIERFPEDFMFQLTEEEWEAVSCLRSQNATSKGRSPLRFQNGISKQENDPLRSQIVISKRGGRRYLPYVFTEQGVAMLSSVLNSDRAIQVNIQIMRAFTKLRELMISHKDLARKIEDLERKFTGKLRKHDRQFVLVFKTIKKLLEKSEAPLPVKPGIGFHVR